MNALRLGADSAIGPSLLEAYSWSLAAALARRHPGVIRIFHGRPGGGQSDLLWLRPPDGAPRGGDIRLNRQGTIQVHQPFGGSNGGLPPEPIMHAWEEALTPTPGSPSFLRVLERSAGLAAPAHTPQATSSTLTWRIVAALLSACATTQAAVRIDPGFIDSSDYCSPSPYFSAFPSMPRSITDARPEDPFGQPGYRFWFALQGERPLFAFEQTSATAWPAGEHGRSLDLMNLYTAKGRARGLLSVVASLTESAGLRLW